MRKTTITIPQRLWKEIKICAIRENTTVTAIVMEALEDYLKRKGGEKDGKDRNDS